RRVFRLKGGLPPTLTSRPIHPIRQLNWRSFTPPFLNFTLPGETVGVGDGGAAPGGTIHNSASHDSRKPPSTTTTCAVGMPRFSTRYGFKRLARIAASPRRGSRPRIRLPP